MDHQGGGIDLSLREKLKNWQGNQGQKNFELKYETHRDLCIQIADYTPSLYAGRQGGR